MSGGDRFTAQVLESGARGFAAMAANELLTHRSDLAAAPGAMGSWRAHLVQRLSELQTAAALGRPQLFLERIRWSRRAYQARGVAESELLQALESLREVLAAELPEAAQRPALQILDRAILDFGQPVAPDATDLDPQDPVDRCALRYLLLVLEGRPREAIDEVLAAQRDERLDLRACVLGILLPAQREIGRLWHLGDSDVAEEHLVTATTKRALAVLAHVSSAKPSHGRVLLVAAVAGDTHDVGGQALALLMEAEGWRCIDLGADVPAEDLLSAQLAFEPEAMFLSATLTNHLPVLERSVRALRQQAGDRIRLFVGGYGVADAPELPQEWGADGVVSSLEGAIDALEGLDRPSERK
jgi:MerR family transcriptional regulator, light-induced transcriptional regulator